MLRREFRLSLRPRRTWMQLLLRVCAGYGAVSSLLLIAVSVLGDRTAPTYLVALLSFWWLAPAPLALTLVLVFRAWLAVAVLAIPAVVCAYLQGPYLVHAMRGADDDPADLRVATYNLTNGVPLDGLVTLVAQHQPDVLLLQEVTSSRDELASLLPEYPYASMGTGVSGPGHDGYAILSRYPVTAVRAVGGLPAGARPTDMVTVNVEGRDLTLLSIHLASPCIGCSEAAQSTGGGTSHAAELRVAEAHRYAEVVSGLVHEGSAVVVGGDLNSSPLNRPLHELISAGLVDGQRVVGTRPGLTRGPGPGVARVDVVLVAGLRPVRVVEGARGSSTHSPVIADLDWIGAAVDGRQLMGAARSDHPAMLGPEGLLG